MRDNSVVGVDIGGSHITAALVDLEAHAIVSGSGMRRSINSKAGAEDILDLWSSTIADCMAYDPDATKKVGIASPGPFDYEKGICLIQGLDKYETLYHLNIKESLAHRLDMEPEQIFLMNDASCFLKGEVFAGAARELRSAIGVTLGTGLGSALYKEGRIIDGDLYQLPYKQGTAEEYLSTRWFTGQWEQKKEDKVKNVKEIGDRAATDPDARELFREFGNNLGEALSLYNNRHGTANVVVGGNIIKAWDLFAGETMRVLKANFPEVSLIKAIRGEEAALLGAGSLCSKG